MEAMAHQVPVIASNIPGNNDIIQSGVNGCLVPAGNVSAISQAIQDALANPDQLTRWATAAQQTIQNNYSLASMVNAHLKLFEQLVT
jgi:glycosyltransferase involved in cell wall biosynthesis